MTAQGAGTGGGPLGIIAGGGALPAMLVEAMALAGREVFVIALEGHAEASALASVPNRRLRLGAFGAAVKTLRGAGVRDLVLAGAVKRPGLTSLRPDWGGMRLLATLAGRALGDDGLLRTVIAAIEAEGFRVLAVDSLLQGATAARGPFGKHSPDAAARADIIRGMTVAKLLGAADVGQSVVVQQGIVLALEAAEGTDGLLARIAPLRRPGAAPVLVKACKPDQDRRVDLPTIGPATIAAAHAAGCAGVAVEAGATLVIDSAASAAAADVAGLFLVGVGADGR